LPGESFLGHLVAHQLVVAMKNALLFLEGRLILVLTAHQLRGLAEDPGVGDRAAPDHHGVHAGLAEPLGGLLGCRDVATPRDRNRNRSLDRRYGLPVGAPTVALHTRATVYRNHVTAAVFDQPPNFNRVDRGVIPAGSNLHGQRDRNRAAHAAQNLFKLGEISQQRRPAAAVDYLLSRAAAVYVDNVSAALLDDLGSRGHSFFVVAKDLN